MPLPPGDFEPRSMAREDVRKRRLTLLHAPHAKQLREFAERLRKQAPNRVVPDFDPVSGGIDAKVLFLFEKPGPKTDCQNGGSGFISIHNNDATAEATHRFLAERDLPLKECLFWNAVPWWNGTRRITSKERTQAQKALEELIGMLSKLRAVVLVGRTAHRLGSQLEIQVGPQCNLYKSWHPSPIVRATNRSRWESIPGSWPSLNDLN